MNDRVEYINSAIKQAGSRNALLKPLPQERNSAVQDMITGYSERNVPQPFSLVLDNSAGTSDKTYVIGDPNGIISAAHGITAVDPDTGTIHPTVLKKTFASSPVVIGQINYQVTASESQFAKSFFEAFADIDGSVDKSPINMTAAKRNNQFNDKLLMTLNIHTALTQFRCMFITVAAGEKVTLKLTPLGAANRA